MDRLSAVDYPVRLHRKWLDMDPLPGPWHSLRALIITLLICLLASISVVRSMSGYLYYAGGNIYER